MINHYYRQLIYKWITIENSVTAFCFLFFSLVFTVQHSANIILTCLLILGVVKLFLDRRKLSLSKIDPIPLLFLGVFSALPLVIMLQVLFFPQVAIKQLDAPLKFLACGLLLFLFKIIKPRKLVLSSYGCLIGAFGMAVWSWLSTHYSAYAFTPLLDRGSNNFINPIEFGCFSLLFGCISLILPVSITHSAGLKRLLFLLKILGFISGITAAIYSGSRAAFAALPLLLWLLFIHKRSRPSLLVTLGGLCLMMFIIAGLLTQTRLLNRIFEGIHDLNVYSTDRNTSIGARFQMWQIAWSAFIEQPILGIGRGSYGDLLLCGKYQQAIAVFLFGFRHAHNEYLNAAAEMGILGLLATLLVLLIPGLFFYKHRHTTAATTRFAATAGLMIVIGHATFCLFDALFLISCQTTFYSLSVVILIAVIVNQQANPAQNQRKSVTICSFPKLSS
ncbi:MAG: O-antigen ligase family protein [Candidatus Symbiodolus clandestinus]